MTGRGYARGRVERRAGSGAPPANCPSLSSGVPNSTFGHRDITEGVTWCRAQVPAFCSMPEQSRARRRKSLNVAKWGRRGDFSAVSVRARARARETHGLLFSRTSLVPQANRKRFLAPHRESESQRLFWSLQRTSPHVLSVLCPPLCTGLLIARPGTSWAIFSANETILGSYCLDKNWMCIILNVWIIYFILSKNIYLKISKSKLFETRIILIIIPKLLINEFLSLCNHFYIKYGYLIILFWDKKFIFSHFLCAYYS